jgi:hypothetical protein
MGLIIKINGIKESEEFRKWLHMITENGIDRVCDIIDNSIMQKGLADCYVLSHSVLFRDKDVETEDFTENFNFEDVF